MSRNGSGTYSLPAGNPVVSGTTISDVTHNATMSDIASEITNSLPRDGQAPPTANLPMGAFKHTNVANASAATEYAAYGQVVPAAGGTYTGAVTFSNTTTFSGVATHTTQITQDYANPIFKQDKDASTNTCNWSVYTNNVARWNFILSNATAESGSNAGSNVALNRYDDAGALLGTALVIYRATGAFSLEASGSLRTADHISRYESPAEAVSAGAHSYTARTPGCTRPPDSVTIFLTNGTAELGADTGDQIIPNIAIVSSHYDASAQTITIHQTATPQFVRPDTNVNANVTAANWTIRFVATWL